MAFRRLATSLLVVVAIRDLVASDRSRISRKGCSSPPSYSSLLIFLLLRPSHFILPSPMAEIFRDASPKLRGATGQHGCVWGRGGGAPAPLAGSAPVGGELAW